MPNYKLLTLTQAKENKKLKVKNEIKNKKIIMEDVLTISKKMVGLGDLVIIPKIRYEEYLRLKQMIRFVQPFSAEKKRIEAGRQEIKKGQCLTLKELRNALGN